MLDLLLAAEDKDGNKVFSAIYPTNGGHMGVYYNVGKKMEAALNIGQLVPAWVLYELIFRYNILNTVELDLFLNQSFPRTYINLAKGCTEYDPDTNMFSVVEDPGNETEEDRELRELQAEVWFDLTLVEPDVTHGNTAAGIAFNPDEEASLTSANTTAWMQHEYPSTSNAQSAESIMRNLANNNNQPSATGGSPTHQNAAPSNHASGTEGTSSQDDQSPGDQHPAPPGASSVVEPRG